MHQPLASVGDLLQVFEVACGLGQRFLRGGKQPNYDSVNIALCEQELGSQNLEPGIVVDCSHGNSSKDYRRQTLVAENVFNQIVEGNKSIIGIMLESNSHAGNQNTNVDKSELKYVKSLMVKSAFSNNTVNSFLRYRLK